MQQKRIRKYIAMILLICIGICQMSECAFSTVFATEYTESIIAVEELDLGDYQSQMTVGEKQLLSVTILPLEATEQKLTYTSSNPAVAKINGMGRITALKAGVTEIAVTCGGISEKFGLTVVDVAAVRDLDLGDCPNELEIGTSYLMSVTVIPESTTEQRITYTSSNVEVATVNELGRITGVKKGTVTITASCGNVSKSFSLRIIDAKSDEIPVTDIEVADHEEELEVDKTLSLSVTVLPSDATNNMVTYKSSDEKIAMVNSSGEVKGISEGDVTITISAGAITKKVKLKIKVATSKIELDTTYLVMQPGESHQLSVKVIPAEADQSITYETTASDIVSVTAGGLITANKCGTGTIIVKNEDTSTAVTVIVNELGKEAEKQEIDDTQDTQIDYPDELFVKDCPLINADMLKYFYKNNKNLTVYGDGYTIKINGGQISNWDNELYTNIELKQEKYGVGFELNRSKNICGPVLLQFDEDVLSGKYIYLYNISKQKYELITNKDVNSLVLDKEGKYLITEKKLLSGNSGWIIVIVALVVVAILCIAYVAIKKQYWFW